MPDEGKVIAADTAAPEPARVRISTWAYLRTMWTLLYEAFASPFTTSVIDATTGKLIERR